MQKIAIHDVISVREGDRIKVTTIFEEDGVIIGDNVQYFAIVPHAPDEPDADAPIDPDFVPPVNPHA